MAHFRSWINVRVAGKTVWSLVNTCHSERLRGEFSRKGAIQMSCLLTSFTSTSLGRLRAWSYNVHGNVHQVAKKQVAGSDSLWQQPATCWSMAMCYLSRSFWGDATVSADHAMTTTTSLVMQCRLQIHQNIYVPAICSSVSWSAYTCTHALTYITLIA